ncbi:DUF6185 family protein [Streptomyces massasporeus]|uniref:DUF6185 family protein n=1 Tax=Streptomyces massasporeus TaxID=67324 RepID=UPI00340292C2
MLRRVALLLSALLYLVTVSVATASAAATESCQPHQLTGATAQSSLAFHHRGSDFSKVSSTLIVTLPTNWALASDLLLAPETEAYRSVMRCLLGSNKQSTTWRNRSREWRTEAPVVTSIADNKLRVKYQAYAWADALTSERGVTEVGAWTLNIGDRAWLVEFTPSLALSQAKWSKISVDLDGRAPRWVKSAPSGIDKNKVLHWRASSQQRPDSWPALTFTPPVPQLWNVASYGYPWNLAEPLASFSWDIVVAVLMFVAAGRLGKAPTSNPCKQAAWGLKAAAWIALVIGVLGITREAAYLVVQHLVDHPVVDSYQDREVWVVTTLLGVALIVFARPRWSVTVTGLAAAVLSALPVISPHWLSLPWRFHSRDFWPERIGAIWLAAAAAALVLLWLLGFVTAMQRIAAASWGRADDHRIRLRSTGVVLAIVAVLAGVWSQVAAYRVWERRMWLSSTDVSSAGDPTVSYDNALTEHLIDFNVWFGWDWALLVWGVTWVTSSVAVLFALRARAQLPNSWFAPRLQDHLLLMLFFPVVLAPAYGWYAGIPAYLVSLLLNLAAAFALLRYGPRYSELARRVAPNTRLDQLLTLQDRSHFIKAARRHRELHAQLRRLEKGQHDEEVLSRARIERMLDRVHHWRVSPSISRPPGVPARARLPESMSPVNVVLSWGTHASWWRNARETARIAGWAGLPASGLIFWAWSIKDGSWVTILEQRIGLLAALAHAGGWQVTWMAGGFLLGALWRVLPGRYGPTKAFFVAAAFTAPMAVHLGLVALSGQAEGVAPLGCALLLLVLTITGIKFDVESFIHERHYWRSPIDLLLSVYQMRHVSVQLAYLLAQVGAILAIWQQVRTGGADSSQVFPGRSS